MSAAYDKLLTTLGLTDEQFKLTYGTVEDLPWRTMSEDVQQLRTEYMGYSDDLVTARREVENYTAAVEQDQEAINAAEAEYQEASARSRCLECFATVRRRQRRRCCSAAAERGECHL